MIAPSGQTPPDRLLDPSYGAAVLGVAAEVAETFSPWHDDEMRAWCFTVEWRRELAARGLPVPPKLERIFQRFERRHRAGEETARNFPFLLEDIPPEKRAEAYIMAIEGYERVFRERGLVVPIWIGVARAWFLPDESANGKDEPT